MASLEPFGASSSDAIRIEERSGVVAVTVNRPQALNAMTLDMIRALSAGLKRWAEDPAIHAVFLSGMGRAFSTGGDMKYIHETGMAARRGTVGQRVVPMFFAEEYQLNRLLFEFPKPVVLFWNGIALGSSVGIAGTNIFRIACEKTLFGFPHTAIGFFPENGSAFALGRAPGYIGRYLGLTGVRLAPADLLYSGLATHFIPLDRREACLERMRTKLEGTRSNDEAVLAVTQILRTESEHPANDGFLSKLAPFIDRHFQHETMEEIVDSLRQAESGWALETINLLSGRSPTSLKVTLRHMKTTEARRFEEVLEQDYALAQHFVTAPDLYEGIRAVLIDKDNAPLWSPDSLNAASDAIVEKYFRPLGDRLFESVA